MRLDQLRLPCFLWSALWSAALLPLLLVLSLSACAPVRSTERISGDAQLSSDLAEAVRTARPTDTPAAIDAHIREVTGTSVSMLVAPYDPRAEAETDEFAKTRVAGEGTDAAVTTEFETLIHDSRGKAFHATDNDSALGASYFAGQPVTVGELDGYILVAKPVR